MNRTNVMDEIYNFHGPTIVFILGHITMKLPGNRSELKSMEILITLRTA